MPVVVDASAIGAIAFGEPDGPMIKALQLPLTRVAVPGLEVLVLAMKTGLTAYDASYLWLAQSRDIELISLDRKLGRLAGDS